MGDARGGRETRAGGHRAHRTAGGRDRKAERGKGHSRAGQGNQARERRTAIVEAQDGSVRSNIMIPPVKRAVQQQREELETAQAAWPVARTSTAPQA